MTDKKVELYLVLNASLAEVQRLKHLGAHGPLDEGLDVLDIHDKLVATLMVIRNVANELSELDSERAIQLWLLESKITRDILRLTGFASSAATAGGAADGSVA